MLIKPLEHVECSKEERKEERGKIDVLLDLKIETSVLIRDFPEEPESCLGEREGEEHMSTEVRKREKT